MHQPIKYRSDIDGLRALAVLSVVFYHANWWPFSGGYVGVDIFFVISGYLITTIISKEMQEGRFSFLNFYERRIRRILPALFAVLLFCSVVSYAILSVGQYAEFSETLVATIFFLSNLSLWGYSGGYFDSAEQLKPLLHTWSLSVEEQFYILFPPVLLLVYFLSRHISRFFTQKAILCFFLYGIVILSFALSAATAVFDVAVRTAFFFLPFRAWELGLGAILALQLIPSLHWRHGREALTILGMFFILLAVFGYDHNTQFPGYAASLPAFGAALIIYAGTGGHPTWVGRLLGLRPLVFIGLISYSLYLWHWPLLAFTRIINFGNLYFVQSLVVVSVSFVLAVLSWRYVERPFRGKSGWLSRKKLFLVFTIFASCFVFFGVYGLFNGGYSKKYFVNNNAHGVRGVIAYYKNIGYNVKNYSRIIYNSISMFDRYNDNKFPNFINTNNSYILIGDSHARILKYSLTNIGKNVFSMISIRCDMFDNNIFYTKDGISKECPDYKSIIQNIKTSESVKTVVISSRYAHRLYGPTRDFGPAEVDQKSDSLHIKTNDGFSFVSEGIEREKIFALEHNRIIKELLDSGKRVVLVYPIPEVGYDVPQEMMRRLEAGEDVNGFYRPMDYFWKRNGFIMSVMDDLGEHPNLVRIKPHEVLCDGIQCKTAMDGNPLYFDDDHLSQAGVDLLRPQFEALFADPKWN